VGHPTNQHPYQSCGACRPKPSLDACTFASVNWSPHKLTTTITWTHTSALQTNPSGNLVKLSTGLLHIRSQGYSTPAPNRVEFPGTSLQTIKSWAMTDIKEVLVTYCSNVTDYPTYCFPPLIMRNRYIACAERNAGNSESKDDVVSLRT
jgi:hypothetical protein